MTRKEIARSIAEEMGVATSQVEDILQRALAGIMDVLAEEGRIAFRNFGGFEVKVRKARKSRNPRTGQTMMVPEKRTVKFKPASEMEKRVEKFGLGAAEPPKEFSDGKGQRTQVLSEADNLKRWQDSGKAGAWVEAHHGQWDHQQWLTLLEELRSSEYWPMEPAAIGAALEEEKKKVQQG